MPGGPKPPSVRGASGIGNAPMLFACAAFATGVVWAKFVWAPPAWILAGAVCCSGGALALLWRTAWRAALLGVFGIFAGLGALAWHGNISQPRPSELRNYADNLETQLTGVVLNDATASSGLYGGSKQSFDLAVESVGRDGRLFGCGGKARLAVYSKAGSEDEEHSEEDSVPLRIRAGQRITLTAKLGVASNYGNPGAFDYRHYLERQGIFVVGGGKLESVSVLAENALPRWESWRLKTRLAIVERIRGLWAPEQSAILNAMLIGDTASIGRDVRDDFQRSGTYHILVVSGFNVGILAFVVFWILRRLPTGDVIATILTLVLAAAYAFLTNAGAPVVRAAVMLGIYLITRLLYRDRAALNAVSAAALGLLVYDPESLFDPSFQLTFLSVLAIAGIVLPIVEMTSGPYRWALAQLSSVGYDSSLAPRLAQFRLDLRLIISRFSRITGKRFGYRAVGGSAGLALGVYETLLVSGVMQFALALPMTWYFHRVTLTSLLANALVVPVTALMMPVAIAALCIAAVSARLAFPAKLATSWMLAFISGTVRWFGALRTSDLRVASPSLTWALAAAVGLALAIVLFRRSNLYVRAAGAAALLGTASLLLFAARYSHIDPPRALEITSIDIGQGDSFLIVTPEGKTVLLDSGGMLNGDHANFDIGEDVVSPFLWNRGISRLDVVAASHTHVDHVGGMPAVIHNFRPSELWLPPGPDVYERKRIIAAAARESTTVRCMDEGQSFTYGGALFEVINPPPDIDFGSRVKDDDAMVVRVSYEGRSVLFCGDIGKHGEERVIARAPHADLLKIAHHGSANATSDAFLRAVAPSHAMISVGRRNSFGHPRPQTLQKLAAAHVQTYRTDLFGATVFRLDRTGVHPRVLALSNRP